LKFKQLTNAYSRQSVLQVRYFCAFRTNFCFSNEKKYTEKPLRKCAPTGSCWSHWLLFGWCKYYRGEGDNGEFIIKNAASWKLAAFFQPTSLFLNN